jgi:23S rRNA (cytosine1962-C5)-methyltransferase
MTRSNAIVRVRLPDSTVVPVRQGHPWVYNDVLVPCEPGRRVVLQDRKGRDVAWGLADKGDIVVRVLDTQVPKDPDVRNLLFDRIRRADTTRARLLPGETDTYRVVNGAGDGLPGIVVDRYADVAIVRLYSAAWVPWLSTIRDAVRALGWPESVCRKLGVERVDGDSGLVPLAGAEPPDRVCVSEHGMLLWVDPAEGQKTGMFIDQRDHRALVRGWASGRETVNLFAYTGGFSVAAALGGAARVVTVDIAPEAVEDARDNFILNGLDPDDHGFEVADAFQWTPPRPVDLLICDPPSLARGRRSIGAARSAYRKLHKHLGPHVRRDGLLASASCTAQLDRDGWMAAVREGLAGRPWSWLHTSTQPVDHPVAVGHREGHYLKFALLRRR